MLESIGFEMGSLRSLTDVPFLPVRLFKELELRSVSNGEVVKVMTSSGTSGQDVSRIYLDKETAANQTKTLVRLVSSVTGAQRMPMIVVDSPTVLRDPRTFSARGAGILGFSMFARKRLFALDEDMRLQFDDVAEFLDRHSDDRVLVFGFTFMVWEHLCRQLAKLGRTIELSGGVLIHGGGWKKLANEAVSQEEFKATLHRFTGISRVHDYYGMVEQTGSIYMGCEAGHLHASIFSDVIVRRPGDFSVADIGETGILEVLSALPASYPGHALLTEDEGVILGVDDCRCGRLGKYFAVHGRLAQAEIRGCSDTYAMSLV